MEVIYQIGIRLYGLLIHFAALWNAKAKAWVAGRKDWLQLQGKEAQNASSPIWIHCSSLGEFEQGRPVIEGLKKTFPEQKILLTFYSPSGYTMRKHYRHADYIHYLPLDRKKNVADFLQLWKPRMAIFVKYDLWLNFLSGSEERKIPTLVISAVFRRKDIYFRWYGSLFLKRLKSIDYFFVQDENSRSVLNEHDIEDNIKVVGDTRLDRVLQIVEKGKHIRELQSFCKDERTIIAGSTWPEDEKMLFAWINKYDTSEFDKLVIVPHEVSETHLRFIEKNAPRKTVRLSQYSSKDIGKVIMIVDQVGILNKIYRYARLAYIGGGFGAGIHNILEAAAYKKPVIFGPRHQKFKEAEDFLELEVARSVRNADEMQESVQFLLRKQQRGWIDKQMEDYFRSSSGATKSIVEYIEDIFEEERI